MCLNVRLGKLDWVFVLDEFGIEIEREFNSCFILIIVDVVFWNLFLKFTWLVFFDNYLYIECWDF